MPWRRRFVDATVSDTARSSPRIGLLLRSTPSHRNVCSLTLRSLRAAAVAMTFPSFACPRLLVGDGLDFLERRHAALDLQQSRLAQVAHTLALRLLGNVERIAVAHDELLHLVGDRHHFVYADAPLVAGALAMVAADGAERLPAAVEVFVEEAGAEQRLGRDVFGTPAVRAQLSRQALRGDDVDGRGDVERCH